MTYEQPIVLRWGSPREFLKLFSSDSCGARLVEDWRVQRLRNLVDSDPGRRQWCLEEICRQLELCISGRQARRLFKASTGLGIKEYAQKRRLDRAAEQLRMTDTPVKAIAIDAGYRHVGSFTRSFLKHFQLNPMDFRRIWRYKDVAA
jgi:AraC-like DNA-binding protein